MTDREKVIRGLETHCKVWDAVDCIKNPDICPYRRCDKPGCTAALAADALALLKEQEAKAAWYDSNDILRYWHCGHCGVIITHGDKYCRMCGHEVKWEPPKEEDGNVDV